MRNELYNTSGNGNLCVFPYGMGMTLSLWVFPHVVSVGFCEFLWGFSHRNPLGMGWDGNGY